MFEADERVRAMWLSGSLGRGDADAMSDLDLIVAVADDALPEFAAQWQDWLAGDHADADRVVPALCSGLAVRRHS